MGPIDSAVCPCDEPLYRVVEAGDGSCTEEWIAFRSMIGSNTAFIRHVVSHYRTDGRITLYVTRYACIVIV